VSANPLGTPGTGVIVTGGASGIGAGICTALAEVGRPVAVWDRDADGAARVAAQCRDDHGVAAHVVGVDVTDDDALAGAVAPTVAALGPVGGLVHGAGIVAAALDDVIDVGTWDAVLATHLRAYAFAVRAVLPELRAAGAGSAVVGISSIEGLVGHGAIPSYTAAKHGIIGLTRSLAHRLGPEGVRVNAVCPGYIETPMLAPAIANADARTHLEASIPLGRLGVPGDIARVVRFLLSDESSYMNGAAVVVDGGVTATGGQ
jgi:NAD(P)-dependent dehydrogenase (short-subunit alcohol dehydrogenase family)